MAKLTFSLDEPTVRALASTAERLRKSKSLVVREAIADFLERKERERVLASFVAEARAAYGDKEIRAEALALAEEALPTDN